MEIEERRTVQAGIPEIVDNHVPEDESANLKNEEETLQPGVQDGQEDDGIEEEESKNFTEEEVQNKTKIQEASEAA